MSSTSVVAVYSFTNYGIVAPISMVFASIAVIISSITLIIVMLTKQLHTVNHLLISNTCITSILYCIVQCNNYIYLLFVTSDTSDQSCRWRGYFGYMSIVAVIYSYLLQAIARLFSSVLVTKYRWLNSRETNTYLIFITWIIILAVPLPSIVTKDIYFRAGFLCWVPKKSMLHVSYTIIAYYFIPVVMIIGIYVFIYCRIHYRVNNAVARTGGRRRQNRDLEVLRNIMILLSIYILGAVPSVFYILTGVELFYSVGIVSVSFAVTMEKFVSILIDHEMRNAFKKYFCYRSTQIAPNVVNINAVAN